MQAANTLFTSLFIYTSDFPECEYTSLNLRIGDIDSFPNDLLSRVINLAYSKNNIIIINYSILH